MNGVHRHFASACVLFSLFFLPLLHCRSLESRGFEARRPFLATSETVWAETVQAETVRAETRPTALRSWQAVPLAGRLVASVPQDFDRWQWATEGSLTLIVHSTAGRSDGVIYVETLVDGPWASVELDAFHHTVAPQLASRVLPRFAPWPPGLVEALQEKQGLSATSAVWALARLRSRTLGRGLGFRSRRTAFTGWRWIGPNPQGVRLRLGRLEGTWGAQEGLGEEVERLLASLAEESPRAALDTLPPFPVTDTTPPRAASMVLGSALLRRDLGVHLAVLLEHGAGQAITEELAAFLDSIRPPERGELESLVESRGVGDLERLVRRLGWQLQMGEERVTEEDLKVLARRWEVSPLDESGGGV